MFRSEDIIIQILEFASAAPNDIETGKKVMDFDDSKECSPWRSDNFDSNKILKLEARLLKVGEPKLLPVSMPPPVSPPPVA